jgi:hypothetical protein
MLQGDSFANSLLPQLPRALPTAQTPRFFMEKSKR